MDKTFSADAASGAAPGSRTRTNTGPSKSRFEQIFSEGKRVQGRYCRIYFLAGTGKIGWAIAKAIGSKPQRNRAKRRFREALRNEASRILPSLDFVVVIAPSGASAPFTEIRDDLVAILAEVTKRWAAESASSS